MSISRLMMQSSSASGPEGAYTLDNAKPKKQFQRLFVGHKDISPRGVFLKADGTKLYFTGGGSRQIHQYNLPTAFDLGTSSYFGKVELGLRYPGALRFKPDGTKVYFINSSTTDYVEEWDLSTAWNITTASAHATYTITHEIYPSGLFFKPDGTRMYVTGSNDDNCIEYDLSTAWDVTTVSYSREQGTGISGYPRDVFFKTDGTKMYITEDVFAQNDNTIREYNLSTAWNVTTASFSQELQTESPAFNDNVKTSQIYGIYFNSDGTKSFYTGESQDRISGIELSTAWDISTASWPTAVNTSGSSFFVQTNISYDINQTGLYMKPDGSAFYTTCSSTRAVYRYNMSSAFNIGTAIYNSTLSVSTNAYGVSGITFKPDGTKMYLTDIDSDSVRSWTLSTAWDITTASYDSVSVSISNDPAGVRFKPDGTRMYVVENNSDDVREYTLSTAWNLSTASFSREFNLTSYQNQPTEILISPNGDKLFVSGIGSTSNQSDVDEFTLSTPWDITSASHVQTYDASFVARTLTGMDFNNDGTSLFLQYKTEIIEIDLTP